MIKNATRIASAILTGEAQSIVGTFLFIEVPIILSYLRGNEERSSLLYYLALDLPSQRLDVRDGNKATWIVPQRMDGPDDFLKVAWVEPSLLDEQASHVRLSKGACQQGAKAGALCRLLRAVVCGREMQIAIAGLMEQYPEMFAAIRVPACMLNGTDN